jgi:hypothetical protein
MFHSWPFLLLLLNLPFTHSSATHPSVQSKHANQFINLLQISTATGGEASVASSATGATEPSSISTTPTGTSATGAATGAAEEPAAIAPKIEAPLPKTKTITVGCGNDVHLKLESASLKVSNLKGYSICQAFCVISYDTSQAVFTGTCTVNGEKFESDDEIDGATIFPTLADPNTIDHDPTCTACSDVPQVHVSVPSFWTEELTKSTLGSKEATGPDGNQLPMRLPVGRSGHSITRVDSHRVYVFGGKYNTKSERERASRIWKAL